jgi:hypothetical protein
MYASVPENGGEFFKGVCTLSNATVHLHDPPPPQCAWIMDMNFGQAFENLSARH